MKTNNLQRGAVLMVSLLILLVLTILAVTALSVVTLEERMAMSFQYSDAAFQGAESGIHRVIGAGTLEQADGTPNPIYDEDDDRLSLAIQGTCGGTSNLDGLNETPWLGSAQVSTNVTVRYLGEKPVPNYSMGVEGQYVGHHFDLNSVSTVTGTQIAANHTQRIYLVRPAGGSSACPFTGP